MDEKAFETAEALIDYLRPSRRHWTNDLSHHQQVWKFRGQSDAALPLVPRAFRPNAFDRYFDGSARAPRIKRQGGARSEDERAAEVVFQAQDEIKILRDFIELADYIGIQTPFGEGLTRSIKNHEFLLERLAEGGVTPSHLKDLEMPPQGLYDSFGLAQHYGLPTRFLDWSFSPLIATYFAAKTAFDEGDAERLAVWALDSEMLFQCQREVSGDPDQPIFGFTTPYSSNLNMYAQKGFFTLDRQLDEAYIKTGAWRPQDVVIEDIRERSGETRDILRKMTLPFSEAKALLRLLYHEGISPAHLMPSLENVERTLGYRVELFKSGEPLEPD